VGKFIRTPLAAPMKSALSAPPAGQMWKTYYPSAAPRAVFAGGQLVGMRELTSTGDALYYLHAVIWTARRQQPKAAATSPSGVQKLP